MKSITLVWIARISFFLAAMNVAHAGPANPEPNRIAQPDGTIFQAVMRGDEFQGWMESADGYTIVKNPSSGFFEYATQGAGARLIPSGIPVAAAGVAKMTAQGLPSKGLRPPRNTALEQYQGEFLNAFAARRASSDSRAAPAQTGTWAPTFVSGPKKILLLLVNFQNASLSSGAATYWGNAVHNASGASVAKYYQDNSYGAISVSPVTHTQSGSPTGVVTVSLAQNHPNQGGDYTYETESAWINSALTAAAPYVNFPALDSNGDGTISVDETLIYFIVAGYETSGGSGLTPSYWAHAWGGPGVSVSGKNVDHWALNGERYDASELMRMGVIAHEMGHAMGGLPDLYDISGYNEGLGIFSLMAGGSWGAQAGEIGGATPVGLDAWSRQYLGWSTPQFPADGATVSFASPLASAGSTVMLMNGASSTSEYWLLENRPPVGWDAGMYRSLGSWTGGLLIQHIDLNVGSKFQNNFNEYVIGAHQGNLVEEPSTATCSLKVAKTAANSDRGCPSLLYYSGNSATFNGASTPNSSFYSGAASSLGISAISAPGSTMTGTVQTASASTGTTLTVNSSGAAGVAIGASPTTYAGTTNYSKTGIAVGTSIVLSAPATAGSVTFSSWSGCNSASGLTCTVTMDASKSVTASYASAATYTLSVNSSGAAGVAIGASPTTYAGTTNYSKTGIAAGTRITLAAPATKGGVAFSSWSGCTTVVASTCTVTMNASVTVTASYGSATTSNLLQNPDFESGAVSWTQVSAGGYPLISLEGSIPPHSGIYNAWLGGYDLALDSIEQSVTIPANATTASVEFWYRISTYETAVATVWDTLAVELYNAAGSKLSTLTTLSNLNAAAGWAKSATFDVSAYKGQTVRLRFTATTDIADFTNFFVDDVSLATTTAAAHGKSLLPMLMLLLN